MGQEVRALVAQARPDRSCRLYRLWCVCILDRFLRYHEDLPVDQRWLCCGAWVALMSKTIHSILDRAVGLIFLCPVSAVICRYIGVSRWWGGCCVWWFVASGGISHRKNGAQSIFPGRDCLPVLLLRSRQGRLRIWRKRPTVTCQPRGNRLRV
jgi:hypothetical protein